MIIASKFHLTEARFIGEPFFSSFVKRHTHFGKIHTQFDNTEQLLLNAGVKESDWVHKR